MGREAENRYVHSILKQGGIDLIRDFTVEVRR
jgi:hypothetical protein